MFLMSFCTHLQQCFGSLDKEIEKGFPSPMQRVKVKTMLYKIIQFHTDVKQLSFFLGTSACYQTVFQYFFNSILLENRLTTSSLSMFVDLVTAYFFNSASVWCVGLLIFQVVRFSLYHMKFNHFESGISLFRKNSPFHSKFVNHKYDLISTSNLD